MSGCVRRGWEGLRAEGLRAEGLRAEGLRALGRGPRRGGEGLLEGRGKGSEGEERREGGRGKEMGQGGGGSTAGRHGEPGETTRIAGRDDSDSRARRLG